MELRQLGGALGRSARGAEPAGAHHAPVQHERHRVTPTPEAVREIRAYLAHVAETVRPHATGATYLNFLDLDGATPQRVRAAYSAEDWARLVALKGRLDPDNVFRFNRNIPPTVMADLVQPVLIALLVIVEVGVFHLRVALAAPRSPQRSRPPSAPSTP